MEQDAGNHASTTNPNDEDEGDINDLNDRRNWIFPEVEEFVCKSREPLPPPPSPPSYRSFFSTYPASPNSSNISLRAVPTSDSSSNAVSAAQTQAKKKAMKENSIQEEKR